MSPKATEAAFERWLQRCAARADRELSRVLPPVGRSPVHLHAAMRYAALSPGKRLRPALVFLGFETFGGREGRVARVAAAVELAHAFSLVHDDLPCMDDDDLRRGRPTLHRQFGEAVALLAGDALLVEAFRVLETAGPGAPRRAREAGAAVLARALGSGGMIAGQMLDMEAEGRRTTLPEIRKIHACKTGALISASVELGALWAGASEAGLRRLRPAARELGLAFQAADDLLNVTSTRIALGKAAGSDAERGKASLPSVLGVDGTRRELGRRCRRMARLAGGLPNRHELWSGLATFLETRSH